MSRSKALEIFWARWLIAQSLGKGNLTLPQSADRSGSSNHDSENCCILYNLFRVPLHQRHCTELQALSYTSWKSAPLFFDIFALTVVLLRHYFLAKRFIAVLCWGSLCAVQLGRGDWCIVLKFLLLGGNALSLSAGNKKRDQTPSNWTLPAWRQSFWYCGRQFQFIHLFSPFSTKQDTMWFQNKGNLERVEVL